MKLRDLRRWSAAAGLVAAAAVRCGGEPKAAEGGAMQSEVKVDPIYRKYAGKVTLTEEEWKKRLTKEQYKVLRAAGTERAFCGAYWDLHKKGLFVCAACGAPLFRSGAKFDSGTGWPSFTEPVAGDSIEERKDVSHGMVRVETLCAKCDGHLGHVFDDGPPPTGKRYCMNSEALVFIPEEKMSELGYAKASEK